MLTDSPKTTADPGDNSNNSPVLSTEMDFIFGRINYERKTVVSYPRHFKLESMRRLLSELGEPQTRYSIIHVAGTKGKGSISKMIAGALIEAGVPTGVYSSPHIETIRERFSVNDTLISEDELASVLQETRKAVLRLDERAEREGLRKNSFFEIITATALLHFANKGVQKVVLEVGLGGRLDSTNVCEPELCVITNISLDHTKQLGTTVDLIAREKAGIIKRGVPVVSGVRDPLAAHEVREMASVNNSDVVEFGKDFHVRIQLPVVDENATSFDTHGTFPERHSYHLRGVRVNSAGQHQAENAAIAIAALNMLPDRFRISQQHIRSSLERFTLIGRGELLSRKPLIVVDMAHNVASVQALVEMLHKIRSNDEGGKRRLVFATSRDKDLPGIVARLFPLFDEIIATRFIENPRATDPQEIVTTASKILGDSCPQLVIRNNPAAAWSFVQPTLSDRDLLCVAGSAYLVAEVRPLITATLKLILNNE